MFENVTNLSINKKVRVNFNSSLVDNSIFGERTMTDNGEYTQKIDFYAIRQQKIKFVKCETDRRSDRKTDLKTDILSLLKNLYYCKLKEKHLLDCYLKLQHHQSPPQVDLFQS